MFDTPQKIFFFQGIPGFEDVREYVLTPDREGVFFHLKGEHRPEASFLLMNPFLVYPDYAFDLKKTDQDVLELNCLEDARVFVMVNLQGGLNQATVNLLGPVVINDRNLRGMQLVLEDSPYTTRHPIIPNLQEKED